MKKSSSSPPGNSSAVLMEAPRSASPQPSVQRRDDGSGLRAPATPAPASRLGLARPARRDPIAFPSGRAATDRAASNRAAGARPLFDCWREISLRVRAASDLRLFLDFDGTLVDFRARPEQVTLDDRMSVVLQKVAAHPSVHVAILSGRRRASVMRYVKVPGIQFFGLYGWEKDGVPHPGVPTPAIARARALLGELPIKAPGVYIEDKGLTLAVHFREASRAAERFARGWLRRLMASFPADLSIIRASNVWEVVPREIRGKGFALREIVRGLPKPYLPVYIGDDLTDEPAFAVLRAGITVLAGPVRPTKAHYHLRNTEEVCLFLERLEAVLP